MLTWHVKERYPSLLSAAHTLFRTPSTVIIHRTTLKCNNYVISIECNYQPCNTSYSACNYCYCCYVNSIYIFYIIYLDDDYDDDDDDDNISYCFFKIYFCYPLSAAVTPKCFPALTQNV